MISNEKTIGLVLELMSFLWYDDKLVNENSPLTNKISNIKKTKIILDNFFKESYEDDPLENIKNLYEKEYHNIMEDYYEDKMKNNPNDIIFLYKKLNNFKNKLANTISQTPPYDKAVSDMIKQRDIMNFSNYILLINPEGVIEGTEEYRQNIISVKNILDKFFKYCKESKIKTLNKFCKDYTQAWSNIKKAYENVINSGDTELLISFNKNFETFVRRLIKEGTKVDPSNIYLKAIINGDLVKMSEQNQLTQFSNKSIFDEVKKAYEAVRAFDLQGDRTKVNEYRKLINKMKTKMDSFFKSKDHPDIEKIKSKFKPRYDKLISVTYQNNIDSTTYQGLHKVSKGLIKIYSGIDSGVHSMYFFSDNTNPNPLEGEDIIDKESASALAELVEAVNELNTSSVLSNVEGYRQLVIRLKETLDKFFKEPTTAFIEQVKQKYINDYDNYVKNSYLPSIDTADDDVLPVIAERLLRVCNDIIGEIRDVDPTNEVVANVYTDVDFSNKDTRNLIASEMFWSEAYKDFGLPFLSNNKDYIDNDDFTNRQTLAVVRWYREMHEALFQLSYFKTVDDIDTDAHKDAIVRVKRLLDRYFRLPELESLKEINQELEPKYKSIITKHYPLLKSWHLEEIIKLHSIIFSFAKELTNRVHSVAPFNNLSNFSNENFAVPAHIQKAMEGKDVVGDAAKYTQDNFKNPIPGALKSAGESVKNSKAKFDEAVAERQKLGDDRSSSYQGGYLTGGNSLPTGNSDYQKGSQSSDNNNLMDVAKQIGTGAKIVGGMGAEALKQGVEKGSDLYKKYENALATGIENRPKNRNDLDDLVNRGIDKIEGNIGKDNADALRYGFDYFLYGDNRKMLDKILKEVGNKSMDLGEGRTISVKDVFKGLDYRDITAKGISDNIDKLNLTDSQKYNLQSQLNEILKENPTLQTNLGEGAFLQKNINKAALESLKQGKGDAELTEHLKLLKGTVIHIPGINHPIFGTELRDLIAKVQMDPDMKSLKIGDKTYEGALLDDIKKELLDAADGRSFTPVVENAFEGVPVVKDLDQPKPVHTTATDAAGNYIDSLKKTMEKTSGDTIDKLVAGGKEVAGDVKTAISDTTANMLEGVDPVLLKVGGMAALAVAGTSAVAWALGKIKDVKRTNISKLKSKLLDNKKYLDKYFKEAEDSKLVKDYNKFIEKEFTYKVKSDNGKVLKDLNTKLNQFGKKALGELKTQSNFSNATGGVHSTNISTIRPDMRVGRNFSEDLDDLNTDAINNHVDHAIPPEPKPEAITNHPSTPSIDTNKLIAGIGKVYMPLMAINVATSLFGRIFTSMKQNQMDVTQYKGMIVQSKLAMDRFFNSPGNQQIDAVKYKYKHEYENFITNEYEDKIDSLDKKDIDDVYKKLRNLGNRISHDLNKTPSEYKLSNFSESPTMEACLNLAKAFNDLDIYKMSDNDITGYKKAIARTKRTFDKVFTAKGSPQVDKIKEEYRELYEKFIQNAYNRRVGTKSYTDLRELQSGLEKIGTSMMKDIKKYDRLDSINSQIANFSETDLEQSLEELKNKIRTALDLADVLFYKTNIVSPQYSVLVTNYKRKYEKLKIKSLGVLTSENKETLSNFIIELANFVDDMKKDAGKIDHKTMLAFSDMIERRGFIINFSIVEARKDIQNTLRLIFKEIPEETKNPEIHNRFRNLQKQLLSEPFGTYDPQAILQKINNLSEEQLIAANSQFRVLLREIRNLNNGADSTNQIANNQINKIGNRNGYRGRDDNSEKDLNKLERFFVAMGKAIKVGLPLVGTGVTAALNIKRIMGGK